MKSSRYTSSIIKTLQKAQLRKKLRTPVRNFFKERITVPQHFSSTFHSTAIVCVALICMEQRSKMEKCQDLILCHWFTYVPFLYDYSVRPKRAYAVDRNHYPNAEDDLCICICMDGSFSYCILTQF